MSHKYCECNECRPNIEGAGAKRPIQMMEPPVEGFLFMPEEDDFTREVCDHNKLSTTNCIDCDQEFITKDSGQRQEFSTGMVRDTSADKPRYDLIWKPGLKRVAELMARGAAKYSPRNWEKASTQEEMDRFDESLLRHTFQLLEGDRSEDHMAAIVFNAFGREMVREKLKK